MSAALDELDKDGDSGVENPGAKDNILVLAIVDDIDENYHNMRQILELLGFPLRKDRNVKWDSDLKMILTLLGFFLSLVFLCPYSKLSYRHLWPLWDLFLSFW